MDKQISKSESRILNTIFLVVSLLSSIFELGPVVLLIANGYSLPEILAGGISYQVGNLAASTVKGSRALVIVLLILASGLAYFVPGNIAFIYPSLILTSLGIQKVRRFLLAINTEQGPSTLVKRLIRIAGFAVAGLISYQGYVTLIVSLVAVTTLVAWWRSENWSSNPSISKPRRSFLSDIMVVHQSHYFSYAYLIPFLFVRGLGIPPSLVGLFFIIGWISYVLTERLIRYRNLVLVFISGHILVAISLFTIALFHDFFPVVAIAWFTSGFGGGTVFCITKLNKSSRVQSVEMEFWEDVGHVLGVTVSWGLAITVFQASGVFYVSAAIALVAASMMFLSRARINSPESMTQL